SKVVAHSGPFTAANDPALTRLGNVMIRFLQAPDEKVFATEALRSFDEMWKEFEANAGNDKERPSQKEVQESWRGFNERIVGSARDVLEQAQHLGIEFSSAEIKLKNAQAENPFQRGVFGALDGIEANPLRFTLAVQSDHK